MLNHGPLSYMWSKDPIEESLEIISWRFSKSLLKDVINCHLLTSNTSQMFTLLCKHLMMSSLTTHCVLYFNSKLRRGDPHTDSTLFGEESLTSNRKSESKNLHFMIFLHCLPTTTPCPPRGRVLPEKMGEGVQPTSWNPYSIYDQNLLRLKRETNSRQEYKNPYPVWDHNGQNRYPKFVSSIRNIF